MNNDLVKIQDWACEWKMSFNLDTAKQAQDVVFYTKVNLSSHLSLLFKNLKIKQTKTQKHLDF